jgi:phosphatidylserine synthase
VEDLTQKQDFRGLPIPMSAITVALFTYSFYSSESKTITDPHSYFAIPLVVLVSILMISNVKYSKLPSLYTKSIKERVLVLALVILGLAFVFVTGGVALFYIFLSVVLFGIFKHTVLMFSNSDD